MKKYLLIAAVLFSVTIANAQSDKEDVDLLQAKYGKKKKEMVADFVKPSEAQKEAFWKLYDEYETQRKELGKQRLALLDEYVAQYKTMTGEQADAWTRKVMEMQIKTDELIRTYYDKIIAISDGIIATQFYQIENYILTEIRIQVLDEIDFVEKKK